MNRQAAFRHLLGIKDLSEEDIQTIFTTADTFKEVINLPIKKVPSLRDITVANLFFENSKLLRVYLKHGSSINVASIIKN